MKKISIKTKKDLNELRNLTSNENIELSIELPFSEVFLDAIDLFQFSGSIQVNFENRKRYQKFIVTVYSQNSKKWIFTNTTKCSIVLPNSINLITSYKIEPKIYDIYNEKDYIHFLETFRQYEKNIVHVKNDIVLTNKDFRTLKNYSGKITVNGNGNTIYHKFPTSINQIGLINGQENQVEDIEIDYKHYDHFIYVKTKADLEILRNLKSGNVVVLFENDINITTWKSIDLSEFCGNIDIVGNNKKIVIQYLISQNDGLGFISKINSSASLHVKDLSLEIQKLDFKRNSHFYLGGILGARDIIPNQYASTPSEIVVSNCETNFLDVPTFLENKGNLIGKKDDYMSIVNCPSDSFLGNTAVSVDYSLLYYLKKEEMNSIKKCKMIEYEQTELNRGNRKYIRTLEK